MSKHLTHRFPAPWHWDGEDPLDKPPAKRIVAQSFAPTVRNVRVQAVEVTDVADATWDYDGLAR